MDKKELRRLEQLRLDGLHSKANALGIKPSRIAQMQRQGFEAVGWWDGEKAQWEPGLEPVRGALIYRPLHVNNKGPAAFLRKGLRWPITTWVKRQVESYMGTGSSKHLISVPEWPTDSMIDAAIQHTKREDEYDPYRARGQAICVYKEMLEAWQNESYGDGERNG